MSLSENPEAKANKNKKATAREIAEEIWAATLCFVEDIGLSTNPYYASFLWHGLLYYEKQTLEKHYLLNEVRNQYFDTLSIHYKTNEAEPELLEILKTDMNEYWKAFSEDFTDLHDAIEVMEFLDILKDVKPSGERRIATLPEQVKCFLNLASYLSTVIIKHISKYENELATQLKSSDVPLNKFAYNKENDPESVIYGGFNVQGNDIKLETAYEQKKPPVQTQTVAKNATVTKDTPKKKKSWLLWPVAIMTFNFLVYLMEMAFDLIFRLLVPVSAWLSTLPTGAVILFTIACGGTAIGVLFTGLLYIPALTMTLSHAIYPSKNGARFYFVGFVGLGISVYTLYLAVTGHFGDEQTIWQYARDIYSGIAYIVMLCSANKIIED